MKFIPTLFLFLFTICTDAQDVICLSPFHAKNTKTGANINGIFRKNNLDKDTLMDIINNRVIQNLKSSMPEIELVIADTTYLKMLHDSSGLEQMATTTSLDVVNGVAGSRSSSKKGTISKYDGQNLNQGGVLFSKAYMQSRQAKYFIVLNRFEGGTDFQIHFELYDKYFTKLYGDKFVKASNCSGKMYFSTFIYYLDNYLKSFNNELVKKVKLANTIVNP